MITLVVARARNGAIGRANTIPWHAPEDLAAFQRETTGGALVMGRRTWESLPVRPLKGRMNIVVSSDPSVWENVAPSPAAGVEVARAAGHARIYGIGGCSVYAALLPMAHRLLVTEVDLEVPDADAFFPAFDESDWQEIGRWPLRINRPACMMREWLRRS